MYPRVFCEVVANTGYILASAKNLQIREPAKLKTKELGKESARIFVKFQKKQQTKDLARKSLG